MREIDCVWFWGSWRTLVAFLAVSYERCIVLYIPPGWRSTGVFRGSLYIIFMWCVFIGLGILFLRGVAGWFSFIWGLFTKRTGFGNLAGVVGLLLGKQLRHGTADGG